MTLLSRATLSTLPAKVETPAGRPALSTGIVHFGPGAFHRAHQAAYIDRLLADDPRWGIAAVSMRTRGTIDALAAQDGLYTLAIRDAEPALRVIAAHSAFLGPEDAAQTAALLTNPAVRLVTSTVTEKGYCLAPDGTLDLAHPDIVHDLAGEGTPGSVVGWIVQGLAARRAAGVAPFTVMPCDNLADNGRKLHAALVDYARRVDAELAAWIEAEVAVLCTMVDSITPASDARFLSDLIVQLGVEDAAAVQREAFAQWVVEDLGIDFGPDLKAAGVILTSDVAAWERAKLRILNGAHSSIAYLGLLRGATSVAEAMQDGALARFADDMVRDEIQPFVGTVPGLDLDQYRADVMQRFRNPAIVHRLEQIAIDGSQKIPYRLGDSLTANRAAGVLPGHIVTALAGWIVFLHERARAGTPIADPHAAVIAQLAGELDAPAFARALAERDIGLSRAMRGDDALIAALEQSVRDVAGRSWEATPLAG
ncbi:mannitol dehydrogenase family protein [Sphingomonas sp.]|uniref:mannitol dehydrogenase family protein n=1 Tax=Sphingomonas sp. TaxID=28214 RepID=UPI001844DDF8|nr:mannitol dehydrogenase family protein [Sphingomonas sp.]MBA4761755.1 mannitol dehydrogenase family protein [Sphingomonas sp.]